MRLRVKVEMVGDDGHVVSEQAMVATVPQSLTESSADELALAAALRAMDMVAGSGARQSQARTEESSGDGRLQVRRALSERAGRAPAVETRRPGARQPEPSDEAGIMAEVFAYEQNAGKGGGARRAPAQTPQARPKAPPTAHSAIDAMRRAAAVAPAGPVPSVYSDGDDEVLPWPNQGDPGAAELAEGIALAMRV